MVPTVWFKPWFIDHFYFRTLIELAGTDPLLMTQLRLLPAPFDGYHAELPDQSLEVRASDAVLIGSRLEMLRSYETSGMSKPDLMSHRVMERFLEDAHTEISAYGDQVYALNQLEGLHVRIPDVMVNYHRIDEPEDAETYQDFDPKLADLELASDEQKELTTRAAALLRDSVLPGYERFADRIHELAETATSAAGVWHLPRGDEFYAFKVKQMTTSELSPDEIHDIGLAEVERIQAEMKAILRDEGLPAEPFREALASLSEQERFQWEDSPEGRKAILAEYERIISEIEAGLEPMFATDGAPHDPTASALERLR